jgi:hypothetical protein
VRHDAAIECDEQGDALGLQTFDRAAARAVAFGQAIGNVRLCLAADGAQETHEECGGGYAVHIVITDDADALGILDGGGEASCALVQIAQAEGGGHQLAQGGIEMTQGVIGRDPPARQHAA